VLAPRRLALVLTTLAVVASALLQGCGDQQGAASTRASRTAPPPPAPRVEETAPSGVRLEDDFDLYQEWIDGFARRSDLALPSEWNLLESGERMPTGCGDATARSYLYCPADNQVYAGETMMSSLVDHDGVMAPGIGLAHEWAHAVQARAGITTAGPAVEEQADCIAAAWYDDVAHNHPALHLVGTPEVGPALTDVGAAEHGSGTDPAPDAAIAAAHRGIGACSDYFPERPLTGH